MPPAIVFLAPRLFLLNGEASLVAVEIPCPLVLPAIIIPAPGPFQPNNEASLPQSPLKFYAPSGCYRPLSSQSPCPFAKLPCLPPPLVSLNSHTLPSYACHRVPPAPSHALQPPCFPHASLATLHPPCMRPLPTPFGPLLAPSEPFPSTELAMP